MKNVLALRIFAWCNRKSTTRWACGRMETIHVETHLSQGICVTTAAKVCQGGGEVERIAGYLPTSW